MCAPPTVSNGAATTREGRMKPHAHRENHTARSQTVDAQVCINRMHDRRHLSTHMMPATIRWTQLARATHKNCDGMHLHGKPPRMVSIRHQRNNRCVTIPQVRHKRHAHENISGQRARTSRAISCVWGDTSLLPMKYARCPRHIARATCDTCDKQKDNGNTSPKTSIHHCTRAPQQDVSELVLHVQVGHARHSERHKELKQTTRTMLAGTTHKASRHLIGSNNCESFDATRSTM